LRRVLAHGLLLTHLRWGMATIWIPAEITLAQSSNRIGVGGPPCRVAFRWSRHWPVG
jgi:hypothetical protein